VRSASREKGSDLVLIGHVGFATDRTVNGTFSYTGGSGYAVAFAASALLDDGLALVTQVGDDFDMGSLRRLGLDTEGVTVLPGASATFVIDQFPDGSRSFRSKFRGVPAVLFPGEIRAPRDRPATAAIGLAGLSPRQGMPCPGLGRHV
jgi:sugar/nucleoside kinase (ribokinase family)